LTRICYRERGITVETLINLWVQQKLLELAPSHCLHVR
jgi:hypothetical protein